MNPKHKLGLGCCGFLLLLVAMAIAFNRNSPPLAPKVETTSFRRNLTASTLCDHVTTCQREGRNSEAIAGINRLLTEFPDVGRSGGTQYSLRRAKADLEDPTRSTPAFVHQMRVLWIESDGENRGEAGLILSQALRTRREFAAAIEVDQELLILSDQLAEDPGCARKTMDIRQTVLQQLSSANEYGRPDVAAVALQRLRDSATNPSDRMEYSKQMQRLPEEFRR